MTVDNSPGLREREEESPGSVPEPGHGVPLFVAGATIFSNQMDYDGLPKYVLILRVSIIH